MENPHIFLYSISSSACVTWHCVFASLLLLFIEREERQHWNRDWKSFRVRRVYSFFCRKQQRLCVRASLCSLGSWNCPYSALSMGEMIEFFACCKQFFEIWDFIILPINKLQLILSLKRGGRLDLALCLISARFWKTLELHNLHTAYSIHCLCKNLNNSFLSCQLLQLWWIIFCKGKTRKKNVLFTDAYGATTYFPVSCRMQKFSQSLTTSCDFRWEENYTEPPYPR